MRNWRSACDHQIEKLAAADKVLHAYLDSLVELIGRLIDGFGPDVGERSLTRGARMVVNIAAARVPALCEATARGDAKPYKNAYDLLKQPKAAVGDPLRGPSERRKLVDNALPLPAGRTPEDVYFGAVEINGTGIRFYGDFCLVLNEHEVAGDSVVLDRNSYDLLRSPLSKEVAALARREGSTHYRQRNWAQRVVRSIRDLVMEGRRRARVREMGVPRAMRAVCGRLAGTWSTDLASMAGLKVLQQLRPVPRPRTVGQISDALLNDEDYIEVLKIGSFGTTQLQEARVNAADTAAEAQIGDRIRSGPIPRFEEMLWRSQRRAAIRSLRSQGVRTVIITTSGRTRA